MQHQERWSIGGKQPGSARHVAEGLLEERHHRRGGQGGHRIGQHLADVGAREAPQARVAGRLAPGGDGPGLQQHDAARADRPFHVLGSAQQILDPARQAEDGRQVGTGHDCRAVRQHVQPELVDEEQLLWQVVRLHQPLDVRGHRVDLRGAGGPGRARDDGCDDEEVCKDTQIKNSHEQL